MNTPQEPVRYTTPTLDRIGRALASMPRDPVIRATAEALLSVFRSLSRKLARDQRGQQLADSLERLRLDFLASLHELIARGAVQTVGVPTSTGSDDEEIKKLLLDAAAIPGVRGEAVRLLAAYRQECLDAVRSAADKPTRIARVAVLRATFRASLAWLVAGGKGGVQ